MPQNPSLEYSLPQLRAAEARLRMLAQQLGVSYRLADYGGMRTQADTNQILNYRLADYRVAVRQNPRVASIPINSWRPIAPFGRSLHNWGAAFDIVITGVPPGWSASKAEAALGALAPQAGLRWGGTFPKATLDPPHFELPMSVVDARAAYLQFTQGKGYQGPRSPFGFITDLFGRRSNAQAAPQIQYEEPSVVLPPVSYIESRPASTFDFQGPVAAPMPPVAAPVQSNATEDDGGDNGRVIGRISSNARYSQPTMMLAGDEQLGADGVPVRTDATDAAHLAAAQEAKRKRDMKIVAGVVVVGLIVAMSHGGRRKR